MSKIVSAKDLMAMKFTPVSFLVPGLIPTGLGFLCGKPKSGKSFFVLSTALGVASGGIVLGHIPVGKSDVLYVSLEDDLRRLQRRLEMFEPDGTLPDGLFLCDQPISGSRADRVAWIERQLHENPCIKMVVIDPFEKFKIGDEQYSKDVRGSRDGGFAATYALLTPFREMAIRREIALLFVHHERKGSKGDSEDPFDGMVGSSAIRAASDYTFMLKRSGRSGTLLTEGRDIDQNAITMEIGTDGRWIIDQNAKPVLESKEQQAIVDILTRAGHQLDVNEVALELGKNREAVKKMLNRMTRDGILEKEKRGKQSVYAVHTEHVPDVSIRDKAA